MNIHSFSSKTDCTNKFPIPKLSGNSWLHNSNVTHAGRNSYQVTIILMENQGKSLINTVIIKFDEHTFIKNVLPNKFCLPKLSENSPLLNSNVTHAGRNNYQVSIILWISRKLTENYCNHGIWWTYIHFHQKQITPINAPYPN